MEVSLTQKLFKKFQKNISLVLVISTVLWISGCQNMKTEAESESGSQTGSESESATLYQSNVRVDEATGATVTSQQRLLMSTVVSVAIYDEKKVPDEDFETIFNVISQWESMLSKNIETSEISQINQQAGLKSVQVDESVVELIQIANRYSESSEGLFDITIGPLVDLWGIGTDEAHVPTEDQIESVRALMDYRAIELDEQNQTVYLPTAGMSIDLGGIAKGYIADRVKETILELGYESALINLGGNVLTVGSKTDGSSWKIGIRNPQAEDGSELGYVEVNNQSVVSSGTYERFFTENGQVYHHILNPFSGYPEDNSLEAVVIVSDQSVDGDALSTTVFLLGLEKGETFIDSLDGVEAIFITSDQTITVTGGLKNQFKLTEESYQLMP